MMADARNEAEWSRASNLMAVLANCHRDPKKRPRPFRAEDFSPFRRKRKSVKSHVSVEQMARALIPAARAGRPTAASSAPALPSPGRAPGRGGGS